MNLHLRKHLVTCALLAGVGLSAQAQTAPATPPAAGAPAAARHHDPAKMAERFNQRLADLKGKLKLAPTQEAAWGSFATALQPTARPPRPDRAAIAAMPTPDRLDHMRSMRDRRNAEMDRKAEATKAFYNQLNAEQKKTFDAETSRLFARQGRGGHHRHG